MQDGANSLYADSRYSFASKVPVSASRGGSPELPISQDEDSSNRSSAQLQPQDTTSAFAGLSPFPDFSTFLQQKQINVGTGLVSSNGSNGAGSGRMRSPYTQHQPGSPYSMSGLSRGFNAAYFAAQQQQQPGSAPSNHTSFSPGTAGLYMDPSMSSLPSASNGVKAPGDFATLGDLEDEDDEDEDGDDAMEDDDDEDDDVADPEAEVEGDGDSSEYSAGNTKKRRRPYGGNALKASSGAGSASTNGNKKAKQDGSSGGAAAARKGKGKGNAASNASANGDDSKSKSTRGSKACTVCRRLKMRCEPTDNRNDTKCKRCRNGGHECVFEESQRGRRKHLKADAMAKSIKNMESTLEMVLKSVASGNTANLAGMKVGEDGLLIPSTAGGEASAQPSTASQHARSASNVQSQTITQTLPPMPQRQSSTSHPQPSKTISPSGRSPNHPTNAPNSQALPLMQHPATASPFTAFTNYQQDTPASSSSEHSRRALLKAEDASPAVRLPSLPEPENTWAPLGLLAEASLENNQRKERRGTNENGKPDFASLSLLHEEPGARNPDLEPGQGGNGKLGVANDAYFQPGPFHSMHHAAPELVAVTAANTPQYSVYPLRQLMLQRSLPSPLLSDNIINVEEAVMLFNIFHQECTFYLAHMINEELHTPTNCSVRSTFLFTTICAVASKFHPTRPELYSLCMPHARKLASEMIERGFKSVEIVQAYILLAYYNAPTERFEDDRTYTYSGIALRMAVELNLWRTPKAVPNMDAESLATFHQERLNRERTWLQVYMLDRSQALQTGRPNSLRVTPFERGVKRWANQPESRFTDAGQAAIVELYNITSGFQEILKLSCFADNTVTGDKAEQSIQDYAIVFKGVENSLEAWNAEWIPHPAIELSTRYAQWSAALKEYYWNVHRLLAFSFALQQILKVNPGSLEILPYFLPCYQSASRVLEITKKLHNPLGHLKYAPDHVFINVSYAAVFLLKLLRPELAEFTDTEAILKQVENVVKVFEECAVDSVHTPTLYAGFLRVLLQSKQGKDADPSRSASRNGEVSLDPALANKLMQQNPGGGAVQSIGVGSGFTFPVQQPQSESMFHENSFAGLTNQSSSLQHHVTFADGTAGGLDTSDPANSLFGTNWNLDQLGQSGFWENLSMPGLGSPPTLGLSAGHLVQGDPWPFSMPNSAAPSRNASPKAGAAHPTDFSVPALSSI